MPCIPLVQATLVSLLALAQVVPVYAEPKILVGHNDNSDATGAFSFKDIPGPAHTEGSANAKFSVIDGQADPNGAGLQVLHDGLLPDEADEPSQNFFFAAGTKGGRLLIEYPAKTEVRELRTFSWHPESRGPQVYTLYGSDGSAAGFEARPSRPTDPVKVGWQIVAEVDTRSKSGEPGGQYAARVLDPSGSLGEFRYLLLDILPTETADGFGNTFYSEIDVVDSSAPAKTTAPAGGDCVEVLRFEPYQVSVDTCDTPDLRDWTKGALDPVIREWYPRLVQMLPSEGYTAPTRVSIRFSDRFRGVAATGGTRISCAARWFRANLQGEAVGSVVHELVHVVQQYGRARRTNPNATRSPGWLVEGVADYIRWFVYEPQSHGADIVWLRQRHNLQLRYDAGYRITANFLDWVTQKYDQNLVRRLNAAMREGKYRDELWQEFTGKPLIELGQQWQQAVATQLERSVTTPAVEKAAAAEH